MMLSDEKIIEPVAWMNTVYKTVFIDKDGSVKLCAAYQSGQLVPLYAAPVVRPPCLWSCADDVNMPGTWDGACGAKWTFTEGDPIDNNLRYCPNCGKPVIVEMIAAAEGKK